MMKEFERDEIIRKAIAQVFKVGTSDIHKIFGELQQAYGDKRRGHHNLFHIAEMLKESENFPLDDPYAFKAAILYHDFVYEPKRYAQGYAGASNEEDSAQECIKRLDRYHLKSTLGDRAAALIRMTEKHDVPEGDDEAALFMDLDMLVLGSDRERYQTYAIGVAREFLSAFSEDDYRKGRVEFLSSMKDRKEIFSTPSFLMSERNVAQNIAWECQFLDDIIATVVLAPVKATARPDVPAYK